MHLLSQKEITKNFKDNFLKDKFERYLRYFVDICDIRLVTNICLISSHDTITKREDVAANSAPSAVFVRSAG